MAKSNDFQHDVYRFLIKSVRDRDVDGVLERWLGGIQQDFESTQEKIQSLDWLRSPELCPDDQLDYLLALVGWDGSAGTVFARGLAPSQKRKLIRLSAQAWKVKGTGAGLIDSVRALTGKTSALTDFFYSRLLIDESRVGLTSGLSDGWITGGVTQLPTGEASELDENLFLLMIDRQGLEDGDYELLHGLINFIRPANERAILIFPSFFDDFSLSSTSFPRWSLKNASFVSLTEDSRCKLEPTGVIGAKIGSEELETWKDCASITVGAQWQQPGSVSVGSYTGFSIWVPCQGGGAYRADFSVGYTPSGEYGLSIRLSAVQRAGYTGLSTSAAADLPFDDLSASMSEGKAALTLRIEAEDSATTKLRAFVGGQEVVELQAFGAINHWLMNREPFYLEGYGGTDFDLYIDSVIAFTPPYLPIYCAASPIARGDIPYPHAPEDLGASIARSSVIHRDSYVQPKDHVLYDSAVSKDFPTWTCTNTKAIPWLAPYGHAIWMSSDADGSGWNKVPTRLSSTPSYQKVVNAASAWPDADWGENPLAPAVKRSSSTFPSDGAICLSGGTTGYPSLVFRILYTTVILSGPSWVKVRLVQGTAEAGAGYDLTYDPLAELEVLVSGTVVRSLWPQPPRGFDNYSYRYVDLMVYVDQPSFQIGFRQSSYTSTEQTWGVGTLEVYPVDSSVGVGEPSNIYDQFSPNYIGALSGDASLGSAFGHPWGMPSFHDSAGAIDGRFEMVLDVWYHHPAQPQRQGTEVASARDRLMLTWSGPTTGPNTINNWEEDTEDVPDNLIDIWDFWDGTGVDLGRSRWNGDGSGFYRCGRQIFSPSQWQGLGTPFNGTFGFINDEATHGPYSETGFGVAIARVRLSLRRIQG